MGSENWPAGLTDESVNAAIDRLLRREDWDTISVKVVLRMLETELLPGADGSLRAHKKFVKASVDTAMARILAEGGTGGGGAAEDAPMEAAPEAAAEAEPAAPAQDGAGSEEPARKKRKMEEAEDGGPSAAGPSPPGEGGEGEGEGGGAKAEGGGEGGKPDGGSGEESEGSEGSGEEESESEEDEEAAVAVGRPSHRADGKVFYRQMKKGGETYEVGQDCYLENGADVPYVARLQEIFVYSFASSEVYFNARWYYREGDVHEYAKMAGASGKVKYEGGTLTAAPSERFLSLHFDATNHSIISELSHERIRSSSSRSILTRTTPIASSARAPSTSLTSGPTAGSARTSSLRGARTRRRRSLLAAEFVLRIRVVRVLQPALERARTPLYSAVLSCTRCVCAARIHAVL